MIMENMPIGYTNCLRLHVHSEPNVDSDIVCKLRYMTEVLIDSEQSTEDFYKIYTAIGAEGFCQKELVTFK